MVMRTCAVALALCACGLTGNQTHSQESRSAAAGNEWSAESPIQLAAWVSDLGGGDASQPMPAAMDYGTSPTGNGSSAWPRLAQATPANEEWIAAPDEPLANEGEYLGDPDWDSQRVLQSWPRHAWCCQVLPDGLIYRSYQAGVREPRLSIVAFREQDGRSLWDGTLGGRVGLLRYGTCDELYPQGWQLDVEAAAIVRLTLDEIRDFETADYRVGVPLTYGVENWQFKFAMYHLSSHLGDEFAIANPGSLDDRINYVRDALVLGASYYPHPAWRLYSEAAYAVNVDGGAEPWEFQFGTELSRPGPTGVHGTPFLALNAHLSEEHDFGGDFTTQAGWLWRAAEGQVMRAGVHYYNGKSSQYQTFDDSEQQIGFGLWYDY
jgi:hypothetical protein